MTFLDRFIAFFNPRPSVPMLTRGGVRVAWSRDAMPLNIYLDAAGERETAIALDLCRRLRSAGIRVMLPVPLETFTRNFFHLHRGDQLRCVVIQPYRMGATDGLGWSCHSDMRFDTRTGEMLSVLIEWNTDGTPADYQRLAHEVGHSVLGLDHGDGLMAAVVRDWSKLPTFFTDAQIEAAKGGFKP